MDETLFDRLCMTDRLYPLAALGLFLLGVLGFAGYSYVSAPTSYTLAVAPHDGVEQKLMSAFADSLREERIARRHSSVLGRLIRTPSLIHY